MEFGNVPTIAKLTPFHGCRGKCCRGDTVGRPGLESLLLEHPGAKFFRKKRKTSYRKEKEPRTRTKKGGILIEVRKGTFLKEL